MFKAEIEWGGTPYTSTTDINKDDPDYRIVQDDNEIIRHIPSVLSVISFSPATDTYKANLGTLFNKKILGIECAMDNIINAHKLTEQTMLYVLAPISKYHGDKSATEMKSMKIDVPYEAIKQLSVIVEQTGSIVDLTAEGQSKLRQAFADKLGIFAEEETQRTMLDPLKSVAENSPEQVLRPRNLKPAVS